MLADMYPPEEAPASSIRAQKQKIDMAKAVDMSYVNDAVQQLGKVS